MWKIPHYPPNQPIGDLVAAALRNERGAQLSNDMALCVSTGKRTSRSVLDRYVVDHPSVTDEINWNSQYVQSFNSHVFEDAWKRAIEFAQTLDRPLHRLNNVYMGVHKKYRIPIDVYCEYASHAYFIRTMYANGPVHDPHEPKYTLLNLPSYPVIPTEFGTRADADPTNNAVLWLDPNGRRVLALGMQYAGENKKAGFTIASHELVNHGVLPMHCAVVITEDNKVVWIYGLSGTGKSTLSAGKLFYLVGDDMFMFTPEGLTCQLEQGCYPSVPRLDPEREPIIWDAVHRGGSFIENCVLDNGEPDFDDLSLTANIRAAFPMRFIQNREVAGVAGPPDFIIFLECDRYGVRPPIQMMKSKEQALFAWLTGYTSQEARTIQGGGGKSKPVCNAYYGEDFTLPYPEKMIRLFTDVLDRHNPTVAILNTGWTGGTAENEVEGRRFSIPTSRELLDLIVQGRITPDTCTRYYKEWNAWGPEKFHDPDIARHFNTLGMWHGREPEYREHVQFLQKFIDENFRNKYGNAFPYIRQSGTPA